MQGFHLYYWLESRTSMSFCPKCILCSNDIDESVLSLPNVGVCLLTQVFNELVCRYKINQIKGFIISIRRTRNDYI